MESNPILILGIVILAFSVIFLVVLLQGSSETKSIRATPSIAVKDGVLTCSASAILQASVDEVFAVLLNYKDYSWASHHKYEWKEKDGIPVLGSTGMVTVSHHIMDGKHSCMLSFGCTVVVRNTPTETIPDASNIDELADNRR